MNISKFTQKSIEALNGSEKVAYDYGNQTIDQEHFLYSLMTIEDSLIANLNKEGIAIIMISHDIAAAVRYASHILHIGTSVFYGTRDAYLESEVGKFFMKQQEGGEA